MNLLFLTQQTGFLKPFAWIMGVILNAIYELVSLVGIHNIAICMILFTFVVKTLMLPLTIKQQKFSRLSSKMNPELTKIQEKYKNKKDEASMRKQQMELQEVYQKYGTNPMSGCLPMLITLPILFALYRVIYKVPAYVSDVKALYESIAISVQNIDGYTDLIKQFITDNNLPIAVNSFKEAEFTLNHLIDIFANFSKETWDLLFNVEAFSTLPSVTVDGVLLSSIVDEIVHINAFVGGMNILEIPGFSFPGVIVPIIAMVLYFVQNKLMTAGVDKSKDVDNPMAQSMKTMNTIMPVMSGIFCTFVPIGVGIYWIASSVYQIFQQIFLNRYMDKVDIDEMIEKNVAKAEKAREKYGIETGSKMASVAKTSTKSIDSTVSSTKNKPSSSQKSGSKKNGGSEYKRRTVSYSADKIADIANILKDDEDDGE